MDFLLKGQRPLVGGLNLLSTRKSRYVVFPSFFLGVTNILTILSSPFTMTILKFLVRNLDSDHSIFHGVLDIVHNILETQYLAIVILVVLSHFSKASQNFYCLMTSNLFLFNVSLIVLVNGVQLPIIF